MATSAEQLRIEILGDSTDVEASLQKLVGYASAATSKIGGFFGDLGGIITKSFAVAGISAAIDKGMDLASQQQSLQSVQAQLIKNQKMSGAEFAGSIQTVAGSVSALNKAGEQYSATLNNQATTLSLQTGIAKNQIIQAQNLLLPNQDLANLFEKQKSSFQNTTMLAANLAAVMGSSSGAGGSGITGAARMVARTLADPAKHMSAMTRYGITLSTTEQARIKSLQASGGLLAAQNQFLIDMNQHTQQLAEKSMSPVERMQNDIQLLVQSLGQGLLPILDQMASTFTTVIGPLVPIFTLVAQTMGQISATVGQAIGNIVTAFTPLLQLFVQAFVPALVQVVAPIATFFGEMANTFKSLFTPKVMTEITTFFTDIATQIVKNIQPGLQAVAGVFNQMANNGTLTALLQSVLGVFQALGPILPTVATSMADILIAIAPLIQDVAKMLTAFVNTFTKGLQKVVGFFDGLMKGATHFQKILKAVGDVMVALAAVWFADKIFLTPIKAMTEGIFAMTTGLLKFQTVYGRTGAMGGLFGKNSQGVKGIAGFKLGKAEGQKQISMRSLNEMLEKGEIAPRTYRSLSRQLEVEGPQEKALYKHQRLQEIPGIGRFFGGSGGNAKNWLLGPDQIKNQKALDQLQALDDNTTALDRSTEALSNISSSSSNSPINNLSKKLEKTTEKDLAKGGEKEIASVLEKDVEKNGISKLGGGILKGGFSDAIESMGGGALGDASKFGGVLSKFGGIGEKVAGFASDAESGGGLLSGLMGGGSSGLLASVGLDAIPGLGEGMMAMQAAMVVGPLIMHHLKGIETGFKDAGHVVENIGKGAEHIVGGIGHAIGGFFGGLFGGGHHAPTRSAVGGGSHVNIAPGAVVIHVNATGANAQVAGMVKTQVEASFNTLLANLKAAGR